jgi:hypothetical protein
MTRRGARMELAQQTCPPPPLPPPWENPENCRAVRRGQTAADKDTRAITFVPGTHVSLLA